MRKYDLPEDWELVSDRDLEYMFDEFAAECCGEITVMGYTYEAAQVLKAVDPVAYRQEFLAWLDAGVDDGVFMELDGEYYVVS